MSSFRRFAAVLFEFLVSRLGAAAVLCLVTRAPTWVNVRLCRRAGGFGAGEELRDGDGDGDPLGAGEALRDGGAGAATLATGEGLRDGGGVGDPLGAGEVL